ncbi:MAG TPA: glycosyltransferase family 39 protein [Anaerolineales bacterium]|nr:glycosyltransferase family 39 protein [Anaerolineales bacterium]
MLTKIPGLFLAALKRVEALLALIFGACLSVAAYCFILVDLLPVTGHRIIALTALAFIAGVLVGYFLFHRLRAVLKVLPIQRRFILCGIGLLLSIFVAYNGPAAWRQEHRYPVFLNPDQTLSLQVQTDIFQPGDGVVIKWLTTKFGEVSLDTATYRGWQRQGGQLVLVDPENNQFSWRGKTGDNVQIVLYSPRPATALVTLNGVTKKIALDDNLLGEQAISLPVKIPLYASTTAAHAAGFITLSVIFLALVVVLASREEQFTRLFQGSISRFSLSRNEPAPHLSAPFQKWEIWVVLAIILVAVLLRLFNLDVLYPYTDEYSHLLAAKKILQGAPILSVYRRSLLTVTLPVVAFFKIFGMSVWAARLPGVIVNGLAILPLYLTARKLNRPVAVIAALLYATSPWVISVARLVREYAYYPFIFFWIIYGMLVVLQNMPNGIVLDRRFWKQIHARWLVPLLLLIIPIPYGLSFERLSTFKVIYISYIIFALFLFAKLDWRTRANRLPIGTISIGMLFGGLVFMRKMGFIEFDLDMSIRPLKLFFQTPPQQWFFGRLEIFVLLATFATFFIAVWQRRHSVVPLFFSCLQVSYLFFFVFFFARYFRPRYVFSVELWYIVVLACGLYLLWLLIKVWFPGRNMQFVMMALVLIASYNPLQTLQPTLNTSHGYQKVSGEYHYQMNLVDQFMREHMRPSDALISTVYTNYVRFYDEPKFSVVTSYKYTDQAIFNSLNTFMKEHPTGWMVIDFSRYKDAYQPIPFEPFMIGMTKVEFVTQLGDEYIWRWEPLSK